MADEQRGFTCPKCGTKMSVERTCAEDGYIRRIRRCNNVKCGKRRITTER